MDWEDVRLDNKYPIDDNNEGYIFGVYFLNDELLDAQWFLDEVDRRKFVINNNLMIR